ncbi:unnamed protein product [Paramecium primaurelia]|uniref:Transmembrane protein n=1 Tax=Paramecium primaurelia TaxID=5886 RepID=A0A8S1JZ31_PARPR|nr:unnamed protein product [Paramecium primaurelia]
MRRYSENTESSKSQISIKKKGLQIAYQSWLIILGIILLTLSILSYSSFQYTIDNYEYIILNWHQQPLVQIKITNGSCSQEEEPLIEYKWPGTIDGCDCSTKRRLLQEENIQSQKLNQLIVGKQCNQTQLRSGCSTISSINEKQFILFPSSNNKTGFQLCATREKDNNFYKWAPKSKDCRDGFLKCGENDDQFYCTQEKVCPIRRIGLKSKNILENYEEGNTLDQDTIIYSRISNEYLPVAEIRIGQGGVCLRNNEYGITNGREDYPLMRIKRKECQYDPRFEEVALTTEDIFYNINGLSNLSEVLNGYEISNQTKWGLYQRSYIPWKMKCRGQELNEFLNQQIYLNEILDGQTSQLIISVFFFVIISIVLSIFTFMNIMGKQIPCLQTKDQDETSKRLFLIEIGVKFVIYVPFAILISLEFSKIQKELDFFDQVINLDCSDIYVKNQLNSMRENLMFGVYQINSAQFYLFFITVLIDILFIGYTCYSNRQYKNIEK